MSGKNGATVSIISSKDLKGVKVSDVRISPKDPKSVKNDVKADEVNNVNHNKANLKANGKVNDVKANDVKASNGKVNDVKANNLRVNNLDVEKNTSKSSLNTDASPSKQTTTSTLKYREREQWNSKVEFVLSCVAFSIGLGNVWRFPYLAYKNGGGAFFIPYFTCLLCGGIPIYFLEVAIGQYFQSGGITVWKYICPLAKGVGYGTVTICFILNCYYIVILAWALLYLTYSFHWELPWSLCGQPWNTENCWREGLPKTNKSVDSVVEFWEREILQISDGIGNPDGLQWWLVGTLAIMWIVCGLSIWRGIKSTGKSVYVTAIFPYFTLIVLFIRGITLPGALNGIKFYLSPDFSKLTEGSSQIWIDAGTQIFFSYAIALGTMTALGSYNKFNNNFYHQLFLVCCMNSGTSVFAGFAIFSVIGFMAYQQNTTVAAVTQAFIAYPKGVVEMPLAPVWAVFFFVMILLLGTGSQFVAMEGFVTAVVDVFPHYLRYGKRREWFIAGTCFVSFLIGLSMVSRGGMYVFQLFDYYGASGICLLWMCFFEAAVVAWFYGSKRFESNLTEMLGFRVCSGFIFCWKYLTPLITTGIFAFSVYKYEPVKYNGVYTYPDWAIMFGWSLAFCSILQVPLYVIYRLFIRKRPEEEGLTLKQRLHASLTPVEPQRNK